MPRNNIFLLYKRINFSDIVYELKNLPNSAKCCRVNDAMTLTFRMMMLLSGLTVPRVKRPSATDMSGVGGAEVRRGRGKKQTKGLKGKIVANNLFD